MRKIVKNTEIPIAHATTVGVPLREHQMYIPWVGDHGHTDIVLSGGTYANIETLLENTPGFQHLNGVSSFDGSESPETEQIREALEAYGRGPLVKFKADLGEGAQDYALPLGLFMTALGYEQTETGFKPINEESKQVVQRVRRENKHTGPNI
ncbi:MAG: hypothetical protein ABIH34_00965 [Nanoarchaeota archaeon]